MNIFITLDYELFFGEKNGTVENCFIKPTQALLDIVEPYNIKFTCFVDSGYLIALRKQKNEYPELQNDYDNVTKQIKYLADEGHGIELHVHPHWEDSYYDGNRWVINTSRYKLTDFNETEVLDIVTRYTNILKTISGKSPVAYRAGGWSAQPFGAIKQALQANNIFIDSTVYPKGFFNSKNQSFDFRNVNQFKTKYQFNNDLTKEDKKGEFTEIPISSYKVGPLFFWRFAIKKLLKQTHHVSFGDGNAVSNSKLEFVRLLSSYSYSVASIDGYKSIYIDSAFKLYQEHTTKEDNFVLIGHPKAFTPYSLRKTHEFISKVYKSNNFATYKR